MSLITSVSLTRRALLTGTLAGAASLLAGCGGSEDGPSPETIADTTLPESYREVSRLAVNYSDTISVYNPEPVRLIGVTPVGDVLLSGNRYEDLSTAEFAVLRYTNRGDPQTTVRTDIVSPRRLVGIGDGIVVADGTGRLLMSRSLLDGLNPGATPTYDGFNQIVSVAPDGTRGGTVTLESTVALRNYYQSFLYRGRFSVSPSGDFYTPSYDPNSVSPIIIRWRGDGAFVKQYNNTADYIYLGGRVAFGQDGIAVTLGYRVADKSYGILPVEPEWRNRFISLSETGALHTDAAGNLYFLSPDDTRTIGRGGVPTSPTDIWKFSPNGTKLARIRQDSDYYTSSLAIDSDGGVYLLQGGDLRVFRRTR